MRKVLRSGAMAVAAAGVAVLAVTGVGRLPGRPAVEPPPERGVPTVLAASVAAPAPVPAPAAPSTEAAPAPGAPATEAGPISEASPTTQAAPTSETATMVPVDPPASGGIVVLCAVGEGGAFVPVASPADCPGSAALRTERAPAAG